MIQQSKWRLLHPICLPLLRVEKILLKGQFTP
eukprot:UN09420